jgi:hypothetical protein
MGRNPLSAVSIAASRNFTTRVVSAQQFKALSPYDNPPIPPTIPFFSPFTTCSRHSPEFCSIRKPFLLLYVSIFRGKEWIKETLMQKKMIVWMSLVFLMVMLAGMVLEKNVKAANNGAVKLKLNYKGEGKVDEGHKIVVFLFDNPDFTQGNVMPIGTENVTTKDGVVTFADLSPADYYVAAIFDPEGNYDGQSMPPSGSSIGMYTKNPPAPEPIKVEEGKTVEIELTFDDSFKMP